MANQIMLVSVQEDETRIAISEKGLLVGLHMQQTSRQRSVGNIYRGTIVKINPAFQAAFVEYGERRNGFLSISDVNFELYKPRGNEKGRTKIQSVLKEGQPVMVQVLKEAMGNKGPALSTFIGLAGRFLVINPHSDRSGVSRKIEDRDARQHLKEVMDALKGKDDLSLIVRTAGIDRPVNDLKRDLEALRKEWKGIQGKYDKMKKPGLLYQEPGPIVRVLRDYFTTDVDEVWVDDAEGFQEALGYFKATLPKYQKRLKLYVGDKSLFSAYKVEEQIESLASSRVPLGSGGSLVIESTEALVSVDVNSGRSNKASDIEDTALNTNLEAATEVARQLRLRNLGGLIVVDFIDMFESRNRKKVEKSLNDALKTDKARTTVGTISQFGLLELSRQRIDMEYSQGIQVLCPNCGGTGHVPTAQSCANEVLRNIREMAATGKYSAVSGSLPLAAGNHLLNEKREALRDLELEFDISLNLKANPNLADGAKIQLRGHTGGPDEELDDDMMLEAAEEAEETGEAGQRRRRRRRGRRDEADLPDQEAPASDEVPGGEDEAFEEPEEEEPGGDIAARDVATGEPSGKSTERPTARPTARPAERPSERPGRRRGRAPARTERGGKAAERTPGRGPIATTAAGAGNGSGARLEFRSEHIVTNPEALAKQPPARVRSKPFAALGDDLESNTVVFDSNNLGGRQPQPAAQAAPRAGEESTPDRKGGSRHKGGRPARGGGKAAGGKDNEKTSGAKAAAKSRSSGRRRKPAAEGGAASGNIAADAGGASRPQRRSRRGRQPGKSKAEQTPAAS